tara:strand:- start:1432 stop:1773 length:342 start_codon:yes stop_codon:yes gene_type:complete
MSNEIWVMGILTFLFVLSVKKYVDLDSLRESIEEYLSVYLTIRSEIKPLHLHFEEFHDTSEDSDDSPTCPSPYPRSEDSEDGDMFELEEIRDMIESYVVRNPELFSKIIEKDE